MTRQIAFGPDKPAMLHGPYLTFVRSKFAFSDYHDFTDWPFLGDDVNKCRGDDAVIAQFGMLQEFYTLGEIPDWVDFIEVASIAHDYARAYVSNAPSYSGRGKLS